MWWLLVPVVAAAGKLIYNAVTDDVPPPSPRRRSVLEVNLERLEEELSSYSGKRIAIIGQPGAGKSSLLKSMTKGRVVPLPTIGNETDATSWAIDDGCDLISHYKDYVFVDVPGYDTAAHPAEVFISSFPFHEIDVFLFVFCGKLHGADQELFSSSAALGKPILVARSHLDSLEDGDVVKLENDIRKKLQKYKFYNPLKGKDDFFDIVFFSNRTKDGVPDIFKKVTSFIV
jgi:GTPase Era involved in 16S rRNA processing